MTSMLAAQVCFVKRILLGNVVHKPTNVKQTLQVPGEEGTWSYASTQIGLRRSRTAYFSVSNEQGKRGLQGTH